MTASDNVLRLGLTSKTVAIIHGSGNFVGVRSSRPRKSPSRPTVSPPTHRPGSPFSVVSVADAGSGDRGSPHRVVHAG